MTPRSYLYVPGDQPAKLDRALERGADALIVDLEDAVAPAAKAEARAAVAQWLPSVDSGETEIWVRTNPGAAGLVDAAAVTGPGLTGLITAKTESATELIRLDAALRDLEEAAGLPAGCIAVVPLLESAAAVLAAASIATAPRVRRLQVGEADLRADLGLPQGDGDPELLHVRSHVVLVSAAARLSPPVAPVSTNFRDVDVFRRSTVYLAQLGFVGRACIHPAQVSVANEVFTPTPEEVERARTLVARFEASGAGVGLDDAGRMVDEAVIRQARAVLARAR